MVTIATYNIHGCLGIDGRLDAQRVADVVQQLDADIVALQEVDARWRPDGYLDQWAYLAAALGCHCIPGISLRTYRRAFGNALLTRAPAQEVRLHDISFDVREPRGAIEASLTIDGNLLRVIATHLGLGLSERQYQIVKLSSILIAERETLADGVLLLGDLNEWHPRSRRLRPLFAQLQQSSAPRTFPSRHPLFSLDRAFAGGKAKLDGIEALRSPLARIASDHLPLRAQLSWN